MTAGDLLLALDLGSRFTGAALFRSGALEWAQVWPLGGGRGEHPGARYQRLRALLAAQETPTRLAYELVVMHLSSTAACARCGALGRAEARGRRSCPRCGGPLHRRRHLNVAAAHAYGACRGVVLEWCFERGVPVLEVHTTAVKLAAVGKGGGAGTAKADVLRAARRRWPGMTFERDDAADAAFVGRAAIQRLETEERPA